MKNNLSILVFAISLFLFMGVSSFYAEAQQPPRQMMPRMKPLGQHYVQSTDNSLRPTTDKWANPTGPYEVVMEVDPSLPLHTIYHPADLSVFPSKDKLPIIVTLGPCWNFD